MEEKHMREKLKTKAKFPSKIHNKILFKKVNYYKPNEVIQYIFKGEAII